MVGSQYREAEQASEGRAAIHENNADYGNRVAQRAYELYLARGAGERAGLQRLARS